MGLNNIACVAGFSRYSFIFFTASGKVLDSEVRTFWIISVILSGRAKACKHCEIWYALLLKVLISKRISRHQQYLHWQTSSSRIWLVSVWMQLMMFQRMCVFHDQMIRSSHELYSVSFFSERYRLYWSANCNNPKSMAPSNPKDLAAKSLTTVLLLVKRINIFNLLCKRHRDLRTSHLVCMHATFQKQSTSCQSLRMCERQQLTTGWLAHLKDWLQLLFKSSHFRCFLDLYMRMRLPFMSKF